MEQDRFRVLLQRYQAGQLSGTDEKDFREALHSGNFDEILDADFLALLEKEGRHPDWTAEKEQLLWELIRPSKTVVRAMPRRRPMRWIAAASILLAIGGAMFWIAKRQPQPIPSTAGPIPDALPGGNKAILKLSGGRIIVLDSVANGSLAIQGNANIQKEGDKLSYALETGASAPAVYNTLTTPRGGQYQIRLPDGTDVWLNSASSITYPSSFAGAQRQVTVTGEAYFEVARDKNRPFLVKVNGRENIRVLGTQFNVNAYEDEDAVRTTLLEGSVDVVSGSGHALLRPGQQAQLTDRLSLTNQADLRQVMAWKNGLFSFDHSSLDMVMRQLSRWYDVDIVYPDGIPHILFAGEMGRDLRLSQVLKGLGEMNVHFKIEGKKLLVMP